MPRTMIEIEVECGEEHLCSTGCNPYSENKENFCEAFYEWLSTDDDGNPERRAACIDDEVDE